MRNIAAFLSVAAALSALGANVGSSQAAPTQAQQQAIRSACPGDFQTYCAGVQPGGSAALQCLQKNLASLSTSCRQAVQAASGASTAPASGTAPEAGTTPPESTATPPVVASAPTSKPAVIVLDPRQEIALMRQACGRDYRKHCRAVGIGGGRAVQCLVSHASALSATCKGALSKLGQRFQ